MEIDQFVKVLGVVLCEHEDGTTATTTSDTFTPEAPPPSSSQESPAIVFLMASPSASDIEDERGNDKSRCSSTIGDSSSSTSGREEYAVSSIGGLNVPASKKVAVSIGTATSANSIAETPATSSPQRPSTVGCAETSNVSSMDSKRAIDDPTPSTMDMHREHEGEQLRRPSPTSATNSSAVGREEDSSIHVNRYDTSSEAVDTTQERERTCTVFERGKGMRNTRAVVKGREESIANTGEGKDRTDASNKEGKAEMSFRKSAEAYAGAFFSVSPTRSCYPIECGHF